MGKSHAVRGIMLAMLVTSGSRAVRAAEYTWTGGGGDNTWLTPANWGAAAFPGAAGDLAKVAAADTVRLNTNGIVVIGRIESTSSSAQTVTVTGDAGSAFTFQGMDAGYNGVSADGHAENRLVVAADIVIPSRIDKLGAGTAEFTGDLTASLASGSALVLWRGLSIFSGSSALTALSSDVGVANTGYKATVLLTNQAHWAVKNLNLGVSHNVTASATFIQDSEESSVTVRGELRLGQADSGSAVDDFYNLRNGTLYVNTLKLGYVSPARMDVCGGALTVNNVAYLKQGEFVQSAGTSTLAAGISVGDAGLIPSVTLGGGTMVLDGNITTPWIPERQTFDFAGGTLRTTNTLSSTIPFRVSNTVTFDTPAAGKTFTLNAGLSGSGTLVKTGAGTLLLGNATTNFVSGGLVISNGVFQIGECAVLRSLNGSEAPLHVRICSNGVFRLTDITSVVPVPLDLEIEEGGKIDMYNGSGYFNRNLLVARSITYKGEPLAPGRYTKDNGFITGITKSCSVVIPLRWNGQGDGVTWSQVSNWESGQVPNAITDAADLSAAQGEIRIDSAVTLTCLIHSPADRAREVTLTGNGSLILYGGYYNMPCGYVGEGCRLTADVPVERYNATYPLGFLLGGGTLVIRKGFPSSGSNADGYASVAFFGTLVFAGQTDIAKNLDLWHHEANAKGLAAVVFTNGCRLTCMRIMNAPRLFPVISRVFHDGGEVICGDLFLSRYSGSLLVPPYAYFMRSGELTATNAYGVNLGVDCPDLPPAWRSGWGYPLSGGSFILSGGTVRTARLAMGQADNLFDLHGGELLLGSGGIVLTTNNPQGTVRLGGVMIRATADWKTSLRMELSGECGPAVLDTAGFDVTWSNTLSGAGGLVKTGAGTLFLHGATHTFTGPLTVASGTLACAADSVFSGVTEITVTNGTLALDGSVLSQGVTLRIAEGGSLTLPAGHDLDVARFYLNGGLQPAGTYAHGEGTVTVTPSERIIWTGAAEDGALWGTPNNWSNTAVVPNGAGVALDFGYSALSADQQIVLDVSPGVTLTNLAYGHGSRGAVLTLTCPAAVTNTLAFPANGGVRVEEGQTLVLDADVALGGNLYKTGGGTLVLNRRTVSGDATGAPTLFITEGKVVGRGEISRVRVQPASASKMAPPPEFVLEGPHGVIRDAAMTLPGYLRTGADQGVFTQSGGLVDLSTVPAAFTDDQIGFIIAGGSGTKGGYALTGGTLVTCSNHPAYLSGDAASGTFEQSGGTSTFYRLNLTRPWPATGGSGVLSLFGGTLRLIGLAEKGYGAGAVNLSGGRVETFTNGIAIAADVPVTLTTGDAGDTAFAQAGAGQTNTLAGTLSGTGGLVQEGPGALALAGMNTFGGRAAVRGGALRIVSELRNATELVSEGGHLALLAASPGLTNLALRTASATARISGDATPFAEGLTLDLAQGSVTELDFEGIADIGQLVLDGRPKKPGLYGGTGSAAQDSPYQAYFTGSGTLRVLTGPQPEGTAILLH